MKREPTTDPPNRPPEEADELYHKSAKRFEFRILSYKLHDPKHDPPTPEKQRELEKMIMSGSREEEDKARGEITVRSVRYVAAIAWRKSRHDHELYLELFDQGLTGLCRAAILWNPKEGIPFLSYAKEHILEEMQKWIKQNKELWLKRTAKGKFLFYSLDTVASTQREGEESIQEKKEFTIANPNSFSPEEIIAKGGTTSQYMEYRNELLSYLQRRALGIKNVRHRKFISMVLAHDDSLHSILPRLLEKDVKTINYAQFHFKWYIPYLIEELGEEKVKALSQGEISRKFTNTLNDIWRRHFHDKYHNDIRVRSTLGRLIEIIKSEWDLYIKF